MSTQYVPSSEGEPRDAIYWAKTGTLRAVGAPAGALDLNVEGRRALGPLQGFGQLWQKTFRLRLEGLSASPAEVIRVWKENFPKFWPKWEHYYLPAAGINPGEVALLNFTIPSDSPVGLPVATGVLVIYSDDESFTFMTPPGHMFAGWNTFSAYTADDGCTVAQIQLQVRANDFAYELGFRLGANRSETNLWRNALIALGAHFSIEGTVESEVVCIDPRIQWSRFWNIWQNAAIRTFFYRLLTPVHLLRRRK